VSKETNLYPNLMLRDRCCHASSTIVSLVIFEMSYTNMLKGKVLFSNGTGEREIQLATMLSWLIHYSWHLVCPGIRMPGGCASSDAHDSIAANTFCLRAQLRTAILQLLRGSQRAIGSSTYTYALTDIDSRRHVQIISNSNHLTLN